MSTNKSSKPKSPRHSYLTSRPRGAGKTSAPTQCICMRAADNPEAAFEQALIDVVNATDGAGNLVRMIPKTGVPTAKELAQYTREFADNMPEGSVFIMRDPITDKLIESSTAEIASWSNLALLARATAAAVRHEAAVTRG